VLHKRWQKSALAKLDERKAQELARIDHLEAVAWQAWERSCQDAETASASVVQGRVDKEGEPLPDLKKSSKVSKGQAGDPRLLERVSWCIEQRCKILGLAAATQTFSAIAAVTATIDEGSETPTVSALIQRMLCNPDARLAAAEYAELEMTPLEGDRTASGPAGR
jgi:hypothetical protein